MDSENLNTEKYDLNCTVGQLLDFIEKNKIPKNAKILYQRIEDSYFEGSDISGMRSKDGILPPGSKAAPWDSVKKESMFYHQALEYNEGIAPGGKYHNKEQYPLMNAEERTSIPIEELEKLKDEFIVVSSPIKYKDDDNLYLTAHI